MGTRNQAPSGVLVTTTSTGTGTYSIGAAAVTGYFHPSDVSPTLNGVRVGYVAVDSLTAPTIREEGEGVLTSAVPWTLSRATIRRTLSAGVAGASAINWAAGTKYIYLTPMLAQTLLLDTDGWLHTGGDLILATSGTSRLSLDSAGVVSVTSSANWRTGLSVPASPSLLAFQTIFANNTILSVPASGTHAYFAIRFNTATGVVEDHLAGTAAGGTALSAASASYFWRGFAWRIA